MATAEIKQAKPTGNKFMYLLRAATSRQLIPDEILMAKTGGRLPEVIWNLSDGYQEKARAYFKTDNGYASVTQDYRKMATTDVSHPKRACYGYYMIRQEVRIYTPDGKLISKSKIKSDCGIELTPVGHISKTDTVYNPPGSFLGTTTRGKI